MLITEKHLRNIIRSVIKESIETEVETVNKNVDTGDWIIKAMTKAGEEYVVKQSKFPKLYEENPVGKGPNGFNVYNVKPEIRNGIIIDKNIVNKLQNDFDNNEIIPQKDILSWMKKNASPVKVKKHSQVYAKQAKGGETIETRVEKSGGEIVKFEAPWGGSMPIKLNDVLIINEQEIYRIARAEFNQTYEMA
jgi:hypothetical protein